VGNLQWEQDVETVPRGRLHALSAIAKLMRGLLIVAVGAEAIWGAGMTKKREEEKKSSRRGEGYLGIKTRNHLESRAKEP
jgi:hypothetical protein